MGGDKMRDALLRAEEFIANELEQREAGGESAYVQEAREILTVVREALK
jgi:hypothetical protein